MNLFCLRKLEFPWFPRFSIMAQYWNQKLAKLGNFLLLAKLSESVLLRGKCKFPRSPTFQYQPLYWNQKFGKLGYFWKFCLTCKVKWNSFVEGSCKFPKFPSFCFWLLYSNRKFGKPENFFRLVKLSKIVLSEEVGSSVIFEFSILVLELKLKTQKTRKFCQNF